MKVPVEVVPHGGVCEGLIRDLTEVADVRFPSPVSTLMVMFNSIIVVVCEAGAMRSLP